MSDTLKRAMRLAQERFSDLGFAMERQARNCSDDLEARSKCLSKSAHYYGCAARLQRVADELQPENSAPCPIKPKGKPQRRAAKPRTSGKPRKRPARSGGQKLVRVGRHHAMVMPGCANLARGG